MATFLRGLAPDAYAALAAMAASERANWWTDLLTLWSPSGVADAARPLRLAVRNGNLNFYLRGQSVARVDFNRRAGAFAEVHVKYAFADAGGGTYARLSGVTVSATGRWGARTGEYAGLTTMAEWMARAGTWETPEKALVERLTAANSNIIDLEMGLPAHPGQTTPLRIDIVALEATSYGASVVLWEAKIAGCDPARRSRTSTPTRSRPIEHTSPTRTTAPP